MDAPSIQVPRRSGVLEAAERLAVWPGPAASKGAACLPGCTPEQPCGEADGEEDCPRSTALDALVAPFTCKADEKPDVVRVPDNVATALQLRPGAIIRVKQRRIVHTDHGRLARDAQDAQGNAEPMDLLQAIINRTVDDSNIAIHPPRRSDEDRAYARILVRDIDSPAFAWWLYDWLGGTEVMLHLTTAAGRLMEAKKKSQRP